MRGRSTLLLAFNLSTVDEQASMNTIGFNCSLL
jgi:hypothetical protein